MSKMRFRPRRLVKLLTVLVIVWLAQYLWDNFFGDDEDDDEMVDFGYPEPDTNVPESFLRSPEGMSTPVVIVEEHFEVLKYWFAAAESGLLSSTGNILVHIDGHADNAVPKEIHNIPLFRQPRSVQEINNMMQRNDVFIVAAALGGLINRYIWVWPPWDAENHDDDHVIVDVEAGTIVRSPKYPELELCVCFKIHNDDYSACRMRNATDPDNEGITIDQSECNINTSGVVEFISEQAAIDLLKTDDWISSHRNIILDIDEDYYGCESAGVPLYSNGISVETLNRISDIFSHIFCAKNTHQESLVDTFFHSFIQLVIEVKTLEEKNINKSKKQRYIDVQKVLFLLLPDIYKNVVHGSLRSILCYHDDPVVEILLQGVVRHTARLKINQLESLSLVGLCLRNSPKNVFYEVSDSLQVCEGRVDPNSTLVLFHTPTPFEIHERTNNLRDMLKSEALKPSLITVCRSVRDGYTPRKLFPRIEADLLKLLHEVFTEVHYASFYYDRDLLGQASGWHGRVFNFNKTFVYEVFQQHLSDIRKLGVLPI